jgi:hypothetical protein
MLVEASSTLAIPQRQPIHLTCETDSNKVNLEKSWIQCHSPWGGWALGSRFTNPYNIRNTLRTVRIRNFVGKGGGGENINPNLKKSSNFLLLPSPPQVAQSGPDSTHTSSWHAWNSGLVELVLAHLIGCLTNVFPLIPFWVMPGTILRTVG